MNFSKRFRFASHLAGVHFAISLLIAIILAVLVFLVWYPSPYRSIMGSFKLFFLVVSVDVVCGPLLTFIFASPYKKRNALVLDLILIAMIQLSAFIYGLYSVYEARPVALVYEKDRLRVLANIDIYSPELDDAPKDFQKIPLFSILQLGTREISDKDDTIALLEFALQGYDIAQRPTWWIPYANAQEQMQRYAKPLIILFNKASNIEKKLLENVSRRHEITIENLWYLPLTSPGSSEWIALIDENMVFLDAVPIDGFDN